MEAKMRLPFKLTFWRGTLVVIWILAIVATIVRFSKGLGASTNLGDQFPWGLWVGFDILCGVGLAAGGFTIAAIVYIFHIKRFYPLLRPTILTAFLGYLLVIFALLFDLGQPWRIWHLLIYWNPHSVLFEVGWCVMLYTTVLALEFSPILFERLGWGKPKKWIGMVTVPLVIAGVILSTLHQSSLGALYILLVLLKTKRYNRKPDPCGNAQIILFECSRSPIARIQDFSGRGVWAHIFQNRTETSLFWLEALVGVIAPIMLLSIKRIRLSAKGLYYASVCTITGFLLNRLNVTVTGMEASSGVHYFPSWMEISITLGIVATGFFVFSLAARYLPIFEHPEADSKPEAVTIPEEVFDAEVLPKS